MVKEKVVMVMQLKVKELLLKQKVLFHSIPECIAFVKRNLQDLQNVIFSLNKRKKKILALQIHLLKNHHNKALFLLDNASTLS